jgi:glutathione peroxidase
MRNVLVILMLFSLSITAYSQKSIHEFTVKNIEGENFNLADLKGKKVLIVNTASKCGLTGQYEGLENLYKKYKDQDFVIIGFPANNFMNQEPGSNEEIAAFCEKNYGVSFPMMEKISVKGNDQHELYRWLTSKELNNKMDSKVKWNFQKYLINPDGSLHSYVSPRTEPLSEDIISWIEN